MSVATELHSSTNDTHEDDRQILGPGGNRVVPGPNPCQKPKNEQKPQQKLPKRLVQKMPDSVVRKNGSVDSSCSSGSSSSSSLSCKIRPSEEKPSVKKCVKSSRPVRSTRRFGRCDWITVFSDPVYICFHDKEWGVPVHDDCKLFEFLCLSVALAEHSWESMLCNRDIFRKLFNGFNPASVAEISEDDLSYVVTGSRSLLSESRVRAVVNNAKQILQVQKEFGSFSSYCWRFVNNKPQKNGFRYHRQVPVKTPKAELMSKDLMRRGFRCVGPTVVYSFMQVSGIVNDHLTTCFRYEEC